MSRWQAEEESCHQAHTKQFRPFLNNKSRESRSTEIGDYLALVQLIVVVHSTERPLEQQQILQMAIVS